MPFIDIKKFNNQIVFFGFCPGADFGRRLDTRWKELGICEFYYFESPMQVKRFATIEVGDLIVLKKRQVIGKTMRVYGYGIVTSITQDKDGHRVLKVDWSSQEQVIEVPLMGCNATIDIRAIEKVRAEMPEEFFEWLNQGAGISNLPKPASKKEEAVLEDYEIDEDSSEQELLAAANRGNVDAMEYLGSGYANGDWGDEDPVKSFKWYMKAAEHGSELGMFNAASYLVQSDVVEQNMELALLFLNRLALGSEYCADANYNLGVIHENGIGIPQDTVKAKEFYLESSRQGNDAAKEAYDRLEESSNSKEQLDIDKYFYDKDQDLKTLAFSFLWIGNHIGEAGGSMTVKERMSALNKISEIISSNVSKVNNELDLFMKAFAIVGGDNSQEFMDEYNQDSRSTNEGFQDVIEVLSRYSETYGEYALSQSLFFLDAIITMGNAVIDESQVGRNESKAQKDALNYIKKLRDDLKKKYQVIADSNRNISQDSHSTMHMPSGAETNKKSTTRQISPGGIEPDNNKPKKSDRDIHNSNRHGIMLLKAAAILFLIIMAIVVKVIFDAKNSNISKSESQNIPVDSAYAVPEDKSGSPSNNSELNKSSASTTSAEYRAEQSRLNAEMELAKAKKEAAEAERALLEDRRKADALLSLNGQEDLPVKLANNSCEYSANEPLKCESRQDQPAMCSWNYSICGSPRLQKKLSKSSCNNRVTLDVQNSQIIVTAGCRAQFVPEID